MAKYELEREADAPEGWVTDTVLERGADGVVHEIDVPDDEEGDDDADSH